MPVARTIRITSDETDIVRVLREPEVLTFGRDPTNTFAFPREPQMSRRAGELRCGPHGVAVANVSSTHSVLVRSDGGSADLEPHATGSPRSLFVIVSGSAVVSVPPPSACRIVVTVDDEPTVSPPFEQRSTPPFATDRPVQLQPDTKIFATALLLCRPLLPPVGIEPSATPSVPELTRELLHLTDSFHQLRSFEGSTQQDKAVRDRLVGRVRDQLTELRQRLSRYGLVPQYQSLSSQILAESLVQQRIVTRQHLDLLDDAGWRAAQSELWWR